MAEIQIIVGSMLGGTEYVAEACQEVLDANNHKTTLHFLPKFSEIPIKNQIWLVCTSTHGAGDYPDNIQEFVKDLQNCDQDLSSIQVMIIGTGDSNYDTYCYAAKNIENLLNTKGCKLTNKPLHIDMSKDIDPEEEATIWISDQLDLL